MEPNTEDGKDFEMAQRVNKDYGRIKTSTLTVSSQLKNFWVGPTSNRSSS